MPDLDLIWSDPRHCWIEGGIDGGMTGFGKGRGKDTPVLFWLPCPVLNILSYLSCPVLMALIWFPYPGCPVRHSCPVLVVIF